MTSNLSQLSSFTGNHGQHDPEWTITGSSPTSLFCLACIVETMEDPNSEVPMVKKKHLLGELLKAINTHERLLSDLLAGDSRVAWHLAQTVYRVLEIPDEALSVIVIEVLVQLCCMLKSEELVCCLVHQISVQVQQLSSFSTSLPALTLLGQLLHTIPGLAKMVSHDQESLTGFLLTGLSYPDEKVKSVCAFILAHAITSPAEGDRQLFWARNGDLPSSVLSLLATGQSKELRVNALGLLKKLLEHEEPARILMQYQGKTSLSSVIKKMLMSRDDTLQVTSVQCTAQILLHQKAQLSHHCQYAEELLNSDVAEFLYETLATVNGLLLSSTFCCLLLLTEIDSFFSKCHTVYGIESIVRAVQQSAKLNNTEALNQGLKLLSEIFKKQPGDIHLMNNDSTLTQLTLTLTDCMTHTETPTVTHATQALADLLRRDQLPSPLPFQTLITTLQALLDAFHRLPKPLVGHSHRGHHGCSLRGHSRQEGLGRSHSKQEMLLNTGLGALHKAFRLAAACLNDPTTTESQFTAPNSQDTKATDAGLSCLIQFLLQAVEGTCIPLVMTGGLVLALCGLVKVFSGLDYNTANVTSKMNIETISIPDIFTSLFSMLCVAMEFDVGDMNKFAVKLVSSFFIQLAITIRNKFPTQDRLLQDAINCFLVGLCTSIQDPRFALEEKQELRDTLQKALPHIHGSADEMLPLLHEVPPSASSSSSSFLGQDDVNSAFHIKQQGCLALLYYAFLYHDKLAPESAVSEAVVSFLANHSNLKRLPTSTAKHLLLLLAMCHGKGWDQPMHSGVLSFLKVLQERDITRVYTHHPCILNWCFGPASPPSQFAQGIIEQWLLCSRSGNKAEATEAWQQGGEGDILSNLLRSNPNCLDMLLDIMSSGGDGLVQEALAVLESVFNGAASSASDEESTQSLLVALRKRLPDVVQRIFMSEEEAPLDVHVLALLRLRCTLLERCPQTELDPTDIKLMYHVINLISKSTNSNPNILQVSLNYLTCLLIQTSTQEETRVVSILLSNTSILQLLESLVSSDSPSQLHTQQCSSLSLVTQIITGQAKFNIRVSHTMTLELRFAMDLMRQNKDRLRKVCGLQLWTALFNAKFESPVLRINCKSALRTLREDEDIGLDIQARDLKSVYVWLQNSIVQGNPLLCQAAVSCMRSLIAYLLGRSQTLAHHLLAQPWNHRLINYCLESNLDSNHVPAYVIQLITMFLQHGKREKMVSIQHLQGMTDYLKSLDISQCMNQQAVLDALLMVQQVIVQPDVKVTLNIVQGLGAFLQQVTNPAKYQSLERQDDLKCVRLNGVVLQHPRSYTMDSKMISPPAHQIPFLAKDLLEKLTRYKE